MTNSLFLRGPALPLTGGRGGGALPTEVVRGRTGGVARLLAGETDGGEGAST